MAFEGRPWPFGIPQTYEFASRDSYEEPNLTPEIVNMRLREYQAQHPENMPAPSYTSSKKSKSSKRDSKSESRSSKPTQYSKVVTTEDDKNVYHDITTYTLKPLSHDTESSRSKKHHHHHHSKRDSKRSSSSHNQQCDCEDGNCFWRGYEGGYRQGYEATVRANQQAYWDSHRQKY